MPSLSKGQPPGEVSYLFPFLPISKGLAFRLAILIFAKTRFCSHIHFIIGHCLHSKVIPEGFRSKFPAFSFSHSNQYCHQIPCAQNSFSRNIMRITIRVMCQKRNELHKQILHCRSALSKICLLFKYNLFVPKLKMPILNFLTICTKFRHKNSTNLSDLKLLATHRLKTSKLWLPFQEIYYFPIQKNQFSVRAIILFLLEKTDEVSVKQEIKKFRRRVQLEAFFYDKQDDSNTSNKDTLETLHIR